MNNFKYQINIIPEQLGQGVLTKLGQQFIEQFGDNTIVAEARVSQLIPYEISLFLTDSIDEAIQKDKSTLLLFTQIYDNEMLEAVNKAIQEHTIPENVFIYLVAKPEILAEKVI